MILLYLLFALTVSMTLTALFGSRIPLQRRGDAFIGFFIILVLAAWVVDAWLVPIDVGQRTPWLAVLLLIVFGALIVASTILSVRPSGQLQRAALHHDNRLDAEAVAFDFLLWFAVLIFGITVMRAIGI